MSLSINIGRPFLNDKTLDEQARSVLRLYGTDAHVYLPGANGVAVSGLPTNNYTLSDGSTGYSAVDGTAGLVLDAAGSVGAELVTNGDFANGTTGWSGIRGATVSNLAGKLVVTQGGDVYGGAASPITLAIDSTYMLTFTIDSNAGAADLFVFVASNNTGSVDRSLSFDVPLPNTGTYSVVFKAITASSYIVVAAGGGGFDATESFAIDNISIREVTGIHATQATTANKPALRRGLYNLLTYSNDLTNAAWGTVSAFKTATTVTMTGGATNQVTHSFTNIVGGTANKAITVAARVSVASGTLPFRLKNTHEGVVDNYSSDFTATTTPQIFTFAVNNSSVAGTGAQIAAVVNSSAAPHSGTLIVDGVGLFQGTLTAAQILSEGGIPLTTSTAASNSGAGRYSHQFDGANDSLLTGNLAITNAVCITIAGRLDSLAATSVLLGEDTGGVSISVATNGAVSFDKLGTGALVTSSAGLIVAGTPFVLTCRLSGGTAVIRKNGTQSATSASGTTFSATTGARLGGTFAGASYCTGALSQIDVIVGAVTDADALTLERNAASNLVAGPTF